MNPDYNHEKFLRLYVTAPLALAKILAPIPGPANIKSAVYTFFRAHEYSEEESFAAAEITQLYITREREDIEARVNASTDGEYGDFPPYEANRGGNL